MTTSSHGYVALLEAAAAARALEAPRVALANRDDMLSRILAEEAPAVQAAPSGDDLLPAPLIRFLGHDAAGIPWRWRLPGVRRHALRRDADGMEVELLHVRAGRRMPSHTHGGAEYTLVLQGAFADKTGRYGRGDIAVADQDLDHAPVVEPGEDCICFAVSETLPRLTGSFSTRILGLFGRGH